MHSMHNGLLQCTCIRTFITWSDPASPWSWCAASWLTTPLSMTWWSWPPLCIPMLLWLWWSCMLWWAWSEWFIIIASWNKQHTCTLYTWYRSNLCWTMFKDQAISYQNMLWHPLVTARFSYIMYMYAVIMIPNVVQQMHMYGPSVSCWCQEQYFFSIGWSAFITDDISAKQIYIINTWNRNDQLNNFFIIV